MRVVLTDGGRFKAGYKGLANDCVCRAIAIVKAQPYEKVYSEINLICRELGYKGLTARKGLPKVVMFEIMKRMGFEWKALCAPGSKQRIHLSESELPSGRIICRVTRHVVAVIDGVIYDNHDPQRDEKRMVYGYWHL